jgi:predicted  nucleic acid-binding Zn-ribbon protein
VKKQIYLLVELQDKDQLLEQLEAKILQGPRRIKDLEKRLQSLSDDIEAQKNRIQELMKIQRNHETEIEDGIAHIRKSRGRLMAIKNNKEYRALVREIEDTEKENASREDKVLSCLEEQEKLSEELEEKEDALVAMGKAIEGDRKVIEEEVRRMESEVLEIGENKQKLINDIDRDLLAQYNRIRNQSGGVAVALVNNATCSQCHMSVPPQMYNELQKQDALQHCPNCQRIIFWKEVDPQA